MGVNSLIDPNAPRFFIDSSVILAGITSYKGASHAILSLGELGLIRLVVTSYVFSEVEINLQRKLSRSVPRYQQIRTSIEWEIVTDPTISETATWLNILPAKDTPILAAAIRESVVRLVTLDTKHFIDDLHVAQTASIKIVTPRDIMIDIRSLLAQGFIP
jgi:predicted nucleic acid-binding protein